MTDEVRPLRLARDQEMEILVNCEMNKMRSHRPIRDWEMDQEKDVFYSNQLLSVVRCQN